MLVLSLTVVPAWRRGQRRVVALAALLVNEAVDTSRASRPTSAQTTFATYNTGRAASTSHKVSHSVSNTLQTGHTVTHDGAHSRTVRYGHMPSFDDPLGLQLPYSVPVALAHGADTVPATHDCRNTRPHSLHPAHWDHSTTDLRDVFGLYRSRNTIISMALEHPPTSCATVHGPVPRGFRHTEARGCNVALQPADHPARRGDGSYPIPV